MPRRFPRVCIEPDCSGTTTVGTRCARCYRSHDAAHGTTARLGRIPSAAKRGYGHAWRKIRAKHLAENPYCVDCGELADRVDHIDNDQTNNDPANLASMCGGCHGRKSVRVDEVFKRRRWKR